MKVGKNIVESVLPTSRKRQNQLQIEVGFEPCVVQMIEVAEYKNTAILVVRLQVHETFNQVVQHCRICCFWWMVNNASDNV